VTASAKLGRAVPLFAALAVALLLAACETPPRQNDFPELTYQHLPPLKFDVAGVDIEQAYRSPGQPPHVEHLFAMKPADAAANWARDRLQPVGSQRRMRFIVTEASVVEVPLSIEEGFQGALVLEQSERYEARLSVEAQVIDDSGRLEGKATAKAERTITVAEDISVRQRERVWFKLTENVMNDLGAQLEVTLSKVFAAHRR